MYLNEGDLDEVLGEDEAARRGQARAKAEKASPSRAKDLEESLSPDQRRGRCTSKS